MNSYVQNELNKVKISTIPNINITNIGKKPFKSTKAKNKFLLIIIILLLFNKKRFDKDNNKFFFFEYNQEELKYCQNYGILIYDYYYNGNCLSNRANIGDYIQSLAALQYLPKNCKPYFIDRDSIQYYHGPKVKLIMNGWHSIKEGNKYVSTQIIPFFLSYHLAKSEHLSSLYIENLKKFSPIGCRDLNTRDKLNKYGINSYFSSCLTTTLDIDFLSPENQRSNDIIFIDYKFGQLRKVDEFLLSLNKYNFKNVIYINHKFNLELTHIERFKLAKSLLEKYSKAKLVITTRIHGALPCLAFHTPVILINKIYDYYRFPGLYELLNTIGINYNKKFEIRVNINDNGFVYNSNKFLDYSDKLKKEFQNF